MKKHLQAFLFCLSSPSDRGLVALSLLGLTPTLSVAQQPTRTITGQITSATDNTPLPGVTVLVKGTTNGASTGPDGTFTLNVPTEGNPLLVFSYIGFESMEMPVGNGATMAVRLAEKTTALNDVVVVGYGTQKKSDLTGSVVSIGQERLTQLPNTNIAQALQGSIPGLQINTNAGGAEQDNVSILVRGRSSISASTAPLIVLDGIPYTGGISDINPADIASIEVLKDASAAAIYGSRGSNGVILVTTKRGKKGEISISYDGFYGIQRIANKPDLLNGAEFYDFKTTRANIPPASVTPSEQAIYDSGQYTDWYELATQTGRRTQHNLSVSGGGDKATFYVGATYLNVAGVAVNDKFNRFTLRPNLNVSVTPWLTFTSSSQLSYQDRDGLGADFAGQLGANFMNPLTTPFNPDGTPTVYAWPEYNQAGNPLAPLQARNVSNIYRTFSTNSLRVELPFVKGLSYTLNTGVEFQTDVRQTYYGRDTRIGLESRGQATNINSQERNFTVENIVNYGREFGKHNLNLTGLYSGQTNDDEEQQIIGEGFPNDVLTNFQMNTASLLTPSSSYFKQNLESQMLRVNYGYDSRYLLTLTARRDGYSGFGVDTKYGIFPSVAVGWNIARESFMSQVDFLSNLKLRASYGLNGNQAVSSYQSLATLATRSYLTGSTIVPGYIPSRLGNEQLGWESTRSFNAGLDFGFFNNRIQGSVDVYAKRTEDLLLNRIISSVQGFRSVIQNIGKTANEGVELALTATNFDRGGFRWVTNANGAYNANRIVDLYGDGRDDLANGWFIDRPIRTIYALEYDGLFRSADEVASSPQNTARPGYVRVLDANGDGVINAADDRTFQGNQDPLYTYGLTNIFSYKGVSLLVFLQGVASVTKENPLKQDEVFTDVRRNTTRKDWWTPENPGADHWANDANANILNISIFEDASFARLKDVSLAYQLPASLLQPLKMANLKVYATARNLATFTRYQGLDPEISNQLGVPLQREFLVGITAGF